MDKRRIFLRLATVLMIIIFGMGAGCDPEPPRDTADLTPAPTPRATETPLPVFQLEDGDEKNPSDETAQKEN